MYCLLASRYRAVWSCMVKQKSGWWRVIGRPSGLRSTYTGGGEKTVIGQMSWLMFCLIGSQNTKTKSEREACVCVCVHMYYRQGKEQGVCYYRALVCAAVQLTGYSDTDTVIVKLQVLVYDILLSTTAIFSYVVASRKLSANEQFFIGAKTVVHLLQTTQIKQGVSLISTNKVYTSTDKTTVIWIKMELFFFFIYSGWMPLLFTCMLWRYAASAVILEPKP